MLLELKVAIIRTGRRNYEICQALGWYPSKLSAVINESYVPDSLEKEDLASEIGVTAEELFPRRPHKRMVTA